MKESFAKVIGENSSPLFRIMAGYDIDSSLRRFENSICAFHIGNGYFLSVSHNLIFFNNIPRSLDSTEYNNFVNSAPPAHQNTISQNYSLNNSINKYRWNENRNSTQPLLQLFPQISFDTRFPNLYDKGICTPYLLLQFRNNAFLGDSSVNSRFTGGRYFYEQAINRHTYLIDMVLHDVIKTSDISIYKIDDSFSDLIPTIPSINIDYNIYDIGSDDIYCLQGAPINELGRLLHISHIEGYIDHFSPQVISSTQRAIFEGDRYLIKGYFRFGSSGAPYLHYEKEDEIFKVIAIQSEACPLQLLIDGKRDKNAQYVNAIATPLSNIKEKLEALF